MAGNAAISAVRLQIMVNDAKGCRKIILKGLYGDSELLKIFISLFRQRLQIMVKNKDEGNNKGGGRRGRDRGGKSANVTQ